MWPYTSSSIPRCTVSVVHRARFLVTSILCARLAACHSTSLVSPPPAPVDPPGPVERPGVPLVQPIGAVTGAIETDQPETVIELGPRFSGKAAAGVLSFSATRLSGVSPFERVVEGSRLTLRSQVLGDARIRVEARGANGGMAADTFAVHFQGTCPASLGAGQVELFPLEVGRVWTYDVSVLEQPTISPHYRGQGTATVEVVSVAPCAGRAQVYTIRESVDLAMERQTGGPWTPTDPRIYQVTYAWLVTDATITTNAPTLGGRVQAPPPPFGREVPRFAMPAVLQNGTLVLPEPTPFGPYVTLTRDVGPTRYSTTTTYGTSGFGTVTWVQRP